MSFATAAVRAVGCATLAGTVLTSSMPEHANVAVPSAPIPAATARPAPSPHSPSFTKPERAALARSLDRYLRDRPGRLSVSVREVSTGLAFTYRPKLRPATASIVKVQIVIALLLKAQRKGRGLTAAQQDLAARAIKVSDNHAADALWAAIGGGSGLAAAGRRLRLRNTTPSSGASWGSTITSAADQIRLLAALSSAGGPLTARNRRYVLRLMAEVTPDQAWGVSAAAGAGDRIALKNGWTPRQSDGGRWTVNSIGRVGRDGHDYLIAVVSEHHPSTAGGIEAVERVSELVTGALSRALRD